VAILSFGSAKDRFGLHGAVGIQGFKRDLPGYYYYSAPPAEKGSGLSFAFGTEKQITKRSKLMLEFFNQAAFIGALSGEVDEKYINIGLRFFGNKICVDLTGFRPLTEDIEDMFLIPIVNVGYKLR
jgi:hypothetical protein